MFFLRLYRVAGLDEEMEDGDDDDGENMDKNEATSSKYFEEHEFLHEPSSTSNTGQRGGKSKGRVSTSDKSTTIVLLG